MGQNVHRSKPHGMAEWRVRASACTWARRYKPRRSTHSDDDMFERQRRWRRQQTRDFMIMTYCGTPNSGLSLSGSLVSARSTKSTPPRTGVEVLAKQHCGLDGLVFWHGAAGSTVPLPPMPPPMPPMPPPPQSLPPSQHAAIISADPSGHRGNGGHKESSRGVKGGLSVLKPRRAPPRPHAFSPGT